MGLQVCPLSWTWNRFSVHTDFKGCTHQKPRGTVWFLVSGPKWGPSCVPADRTLAKVNAHQMSQQKLPTWWLSKEQEVPRRTVRTEMCITQGLRKFKTLTVSPLQLPPVPRFTDINCRPPRSRCFISQSLWKSPWAVNRMAEAKVCITPECVPSIRQPTHHLQEDRRTLKDQDLDLQGTHCPFSRGEIPFEAHSTWDLLFIQQVCTKLLCVLGLVTAIFCGNLLQQPE